MTALQHLDDPQLRTRGVARLLADDPAQQKTIAAMRTQLFETLEKTAGLKIPLYMPRLGRQRLRNPEGSQAQPFPESFVKKP